MTRKKVKLAYITNDSARKATYKKRKKGLIKKVSELSTLCGINACAIIYSPYDSQPEVWSSAIGVQRVLQDFKMLPEMDQSKKMVNQETFLMQRINKATDHLKKQRKDNREKEMTHIMFQCLVGRMSLHHLTMMDLNDLGWVIEQYLKDIQRRKETLKKTETRNVQTVVTGATIAVPQNHVVMNSGENSNYNGGEHVEGTKIRNGLDMNVTDSTQRQQQQWFMDFMNPQQNIAFDAEEMILPPFPDANQNSMWPGPFFP